MTLLLTYLKAALEMDYFELWLCGFSEMGIYVKKRQKMAFIDGVLGLNMTSSDYWVI